MARFFHARGMAGPALVSGLIALLACQSPNATGNTGSTPQPLAAQQDRLYRGPSRDLTPDERAGGHILRKHVGLTDDDLRERLAREREISGASTFTDRRTAEHVVGAAIAKSQGRIQGWLSRPGRHSNLVLDYDGDEPIGRTMNRGAYQAQPCTHAVVVLKYDGPNDYYVLTSYPECR